MLAYVIHFALDKGKFSPQVETPKIPRLARSEPLPKCLERFSGRVFVQLNTLFQLRSSFCYNETHRKLIKANEDGIKNMPELEVDL